MEENRRFGRIRQRFSPSSFPQKPRGFSTEVRNYLTTVLVEGMRKHLCFGCAVSKLYDKNNKEYLIPRNMTLEEVKNIVEEIKKVNSDGASIS